MSWFEKLKAIKANSNMSTKEIAIKSGIPEPTLEKIFSGATKSPGINTIQSLVHALGYTLDVIDTVHRQNSEGKGENESTPVSKDGLTEEQSKIVSLYKAAPPALRAAAFAVLKSAEEQGTVPDDVPTSE